MYEKLSLTYLKIPLLKNKIRSGVMLPNYIKYKIQRGKEMKTNTADIDQI